MLNIPTARSLLRRTRPRRHADGYPADVRAQVVALAQTRVAEGRSVHAVARELGLHGSTLRRWLEPSLAAAPAFVSVTVEPAGVSRPGPDGATVVEAAGCPASSGPLTLTSPSGFRLEGLGLDDAITALRRLS